MKQHAGPLSQARHGLVSQAWRSLLFIVVALLSLPTHAVAQAIVGRVVDSESSTPVAGAELVLLDSGDQPRLRGFSDSQGDFQIQTAGPGRFRLRVTSIGHVAFTSDVLDVGRGDILTVEIRLGVDAIPLDAITVVAPRSAEAAHLRDFNERRTNPGGSSGYFMTADDVERRPAATATRLLYEVPAVSIRPIGDGGGLDRSLIMLRGIRGPCLANVFVDGTRIRQSQDHSIDDILDPSLIAGVEAYPRGLAAPVQYQVDPDCGVVLYWTARPAGGGSWSTKRILAGVAVVGGLVLAAFGFGG